MNHPRLISGFTSNGLHVSHSNGRGHIVIVGAGLAGLFTALKLAPHPVTVITASRLGSGAASAWAQGGIAAAVGEGDTCESHANDTIATGAGLVDDVVAKTVAEEAPQRILDLLNIGVPFDKRDDGTFALSREAAHSAKRIVRVSGDKAGAAIMQALIAEVRKTPSIRILENTELADLTVDKGAISGIRVRVHGQNPNTNTNDFPATAVVLATGGIGALYATTTNPPYARGQALAIAARVGALICDAEFVQFHPTALDVGIDPAPLATEALRGEGAQLVNKNADPFMTRYHPDGDLAPRDLVAVAVMQELNAGRGAFLDCRSAIGKSFALRFPTVFAHCQSAGLNPATDLLPVAPAAHYHMGGIATDLRARTNIKGLWAVGEVAATGLHGANRLASNSLLENVVFGARAAEDIASLVDAPAHISLPNLGTEQARAHENDNHHTSNIDVSKLRTLMSQHAGIARTKSGLRTCLNRLSDFAIEMSPNIQFADMVLAAQLITAAALKRNESRGAHIFIDKQNSTSEPLRHSYVTINDLEHTLPNDDVIEQRRTFEKTNLLEVTVS